MKAISLIAEKKGETFAIDRQRMARLIETLPDGKYEVSIEKASKLGVQQRKYYFAVVVRAFSEYWGVDRDDAHALLKEHQNQKVIEIVDKQSGEVVEEVVAGSTAGFTTEQWTEYIEKCQRWGATDFGFVVPDPDKEWMFNQKDPAA